jgi:hypothetical protein
MAPKAKPLSEATKAALRKKAEGTRFTYGQLAAVYRRGQGAICRAERKCQWLHGQWAGSKFCFGHPRKPDLLKKKKKYGQEKRPALRTPGLSGYTSQNARQAIQRKVTSFWRRRVIGSNSFVSVSRALRRSHLARESRRLIRTSVRRLRRVKPDGVDVQELLEFKRNVEQNKLESEGKYTEARQALEQQFREAAEAKDKRIAELEARVRELELIAPANTALADVVHDPSIVFKADLLKPDQIEREADGTVVVVNGYERKPIGEWAKTLPSYMQKAPKPRQWCAFRTQHRWRHPARHKESFCQRVLQPHRTVAAFRTDRDMYERLKAAANR